MAINEKILEKLLSNEPDWLSEELRAWAPMEELIEVTLRSGRTLRFRAIKGYDQLQAITEQSREFVKACQEGTFEAYNAWPCRDLTTLGVIGTMAETSVDEPRLSHASLLHMAHDAVFLFEEIRQQYLAKQYGLMKADEAEAVKAAKNGSSPTLSGDGD